MEGAVRYDTMRRTLAIAGGLLFVASLLYFVACYSWFFDTPDEPSGETATSIVVDLVLFTVFALHHSVFARPRVKSWVRETVSPPMERSAYVWLSSALFIITCAWWQPIRGELWHATGITARLLQLVQIAGGVLCVLSARRLDVLELAGVRQVFGTTTARPQHLDTSGPYAFVRHPIYFGWMLFVWLPPVMNGTRLVFAAISTFYLVIAVPFEERDLIRTFGSMYSDYRRRVRWRMLPFVY